jgi:hypothetical protein
MITVRTARNTYTINEDEILPPPFTEEREAIVLKINNHVTINLMNASSQTGNLLSELGQYAQAEIQYRLAAANALELFKKSLTDKELDTEEYKKIYKECLQAEIDCRSMRLHGKIGALVLPGSIVNAKVASKEKPNFIVPLLIIGAVIYAMIKFGS